MTRIRFKVPARDLEDPTAPRRAVDDVLGVKGGGSPYGSTTYKRKRLCPFEDGLVSVARLRPDRDAEALDVGLICHAAWEAYYRTILEHQRELPVPDRRDTAAMERYCFGATSRAENAALDVVELFAEEPHYRATYDTCTKLIAGYFDRYRGHDWWQILAVEETLIYQDAEPYGLPRLYDEDNHGKHAIPFEPFAYSARLDTMIRDIAPGRGGVYNVEHKTAKFINEDLVYGYQQDMQILGQHWLIDRCIDPDALPGPVMGVIVNIGTKQKTATFERVEVCPSPYHLAAFEDSARRWWVVNQLTGDFAGFPKALGSCAGALRGYSRCSYYDLCHAYPERTMQDFIELPPPVGYHRKET